MRDAVPDRHRDEYDSLLNEALSISNLREERALVCDFWALGLVRRALKVAGQRLQQAGRVRAARHLFEATHEEMLGLLTAGKATVSADDLASAMPTAPARPAMWRQRRSASRPPHRRRRSGIHPPRVA